MNQQQRELWKLLWQDCVQLHSDLEEFEYLFSEDKDRIALMNEASSNFLGHLRQTLWTSLLLQVCRLTDPPQSAGKSNLSIRSFLQESSADGDAVIQDRAKVLVDVAVAKSRFARDWRNRRIAHRDLTNATGASLCANASLLGVREAAKSIGEVIDAFDDGYGQTHWYPGVAAAGIPILLQYLQEGVLSQKQRIEAQHRGELPWGNTWLQKGESHNTQP